jgi:cystathionine gamma-synthase
VPSPFDCWLALRGLETFALRHDRAEATARALAAFLPGLPGVRRVIYPGRADHPDHARAERLLGPRTGNLLSFEIAGGRAAANAFVRAAARAPDGRGGLAFAPTLGDVATTLSHPASSSHRGLAPAERAALGITEGFFRLSVGLEDPEVLMADLARGAAAAAATV